MSKKKNTSTNHNANPPALKIGSRVRCTDDGVTGRIVWANAVSVKIKWHDGEQVTWKRDSLATRPIEILDADNDDQTTTPPATEIPEATNVVTAGDQATGAQILPAEESPVEPETAPVTVEPTTEPEPTAAM